MSDECAAATHKQCEAAMVNRVYTSRPVVYCRGVVVYPLLASACISERDIPPGIPVCSQRHS
eukprot:scaffold50999_cov56-Phaeocystis_antarctica.AAC.7